LIIEECDADWFHTLATTFSNLLDVRFVAQHVLRTGEFSVTYQTLKQLEVGYRQLVRRVDAEISRRSLGTAVPGKHRGLHLDGRIIWDQQGHDRDLWPLFSPKDGYRKEIFEL
jgi:hypothetical protein